MNIESELEAHGWERRSVLCEPRLSECVELYKQLGFEVKVMALDPNSMPEGCTLCYEKEIEKYRVIYVRKKGQEGTEAAF